MTFQNYEFDEQYRPLNFSEKAREEINFGLAFYLKGKYIFQDAFEEAAGKIENDHIYVYCPKNDETFDFKPRNGQKIENEPCPNEASCCRCCDLKNAVKMHKGLNRAIDVAFYQRTNRGVVLRAFTYAFDFSGERYDIYRQGEESQTEWMRVFYNTDRSTEIYSKRVKAYSGNAGYFFTIGHNWWKKKSFQKNTSFSVVDENLKGTLLEGYQKYAELAEGYIDDCVKRAVLYQALFRTPALGAVIKSGYGGIAEEYVRSFAEPANKPGKIINKGARTIKQFFRCELSKLDKLSAETKDNLTIKDMYLLHYLIGRNIKIMEESLKICSNNKFFELADDLSAADLRETLKYLAKQKDIPQEHVLGDYYDYMRQVRKLGMDKDNRQVLYPKSLKRAHERLSILERAMSKTERSKAFERSAKEYLPYSFRQRNLSLRPIRTIAELRVWAERFNNCSYGYVDRIADGRSMIFIIVNRFERKSPYYMLEYDPKTKKIVQCRGKNNTGTIKSDEKIKQFVDQWLKFIKSKEFKRKLRTKKELNAA